METLFGITRLSLEHQKKQSESTRLRIFPILILCVCVRKFSENVTKALINKQYARMKEFC